MIQLRRLLGSLLLSCSISACATVEVPNFRAYVTLPASGDGFGVKTVTREEVTIPKKEWDEKRQRGIVILSEDWKILKLTVRKNCITNKCKQAVGALDGLFFAIDKALKKVGP